jgi:predicted SprT family Zn-dependent metalloprotease
MANLTKLEQKANELLNSNITYCFGTVNLASRGWRFKGFDRATKRAGVCARRGFDKYISLSKLIMTAFTEEEAMNTLTHEIAHAIDNEYRGRSSHDNTWKMIHQSIGGTGERCYTPSEEVKKATQSLAKYVGVCTKCGKEVRTWQRKPKYYGAPVGTIYHTNCGGGIEIKKLN